VFAVVVAADWTELAEHLSSAIPRYMTSRVTESAQSMARCRPAAGQRVTVDRIQDLIMQASSDASGGKTNTLESAQSVISPVLCGEVLARGNNDGLLDEKRSFEGVQRKLHRSLPPCSWNGDALQYRSTPLRAASVSFGSTTLSAGEAFGTMGNNRSRHANRSSRGPVAAKRCRSLTACVNRPRVCDFMNEVASKAQCMLEVGAYVHWFERYGCVEDDMWQAVCMLQDIIDDYMSAV